VTSSANTENHPQQDTAEDESLRLKQEQLTEASFHATYSAVINLFKVKQKKYQKTFDLAFLEGKITLQAIAVFSILALLACAFVTTLWLLTNVAIVFGVLQLYSSLWLGLLVAAGANVLMLGIFFYLMRKVKRQVGFTRTKRVVKGDI
jgi:hypothetical protein